MEISRERKERIVNYIKKYPNKTPYQYAIILREGYIATCMVIREFELEDACVTRYNSVRHLIQEDIEYLDTFDRENWKTLNKLLFFREKSSTLERLYDEQGGLGRRRELYVHTGKPRIIKENRHLSFEELSALINESPEDIEQYLHKLDNTAPRGVNNPIHAERKAYIKENAHKGSTVLSEELGVEIVTISLYYQELGLTGKAYQLPVPQNCRFDSITPEMAEYVSKNTHLNLTRLVFLLGVDYFLLLSYLKERGIKLRGGYGVISPDRARYMVENNNLSNAELERRLGVILPTIADFFNNQRMTRRRKGIKESQIHFIDANPHLTIPELASRTGLNPDVIKRYLCNTGQTLKGREATSWKTTEPKRSDNLEKDLSKHHMYIVKHRSLSIPELAKQLNCTPMVLMTYMQENNIPLT